MKYCGVYTIHQQETFSSELAVGSKKEHLIAVIWKVFFFLSVPIPELYFIQHGVKSFFSILWFLVVSIEYAQFSTLSLGEGEPWGLRMQNFEVFIFIFIDRH